MKKEEAKIKKKLKELRKKLESHPLNIVKFHRVELEDFEINAFYLEFFTDLELKDFFSKIFTDLMERYSYGIRLTTKDKKEGEDGRVDFMVWFYKEKIIEDFINVLEDRLEKDK